MIDISVVSPVYRSASLVRSFVERVSAVLEKMQVSYEIILVDDGSTDRSWGEIEKICGENEKVKGILLSRNFGQHYAITAGLENVSATWVVVMDSDLQDIPEEIERLYSKAQAGHEIVLARRKHRKDGFLKKTTSKVFYKVFGYLTNTKQDPAIANFGVYNRKVIDAVLKMGDHIRFFPILVQWVGFKRTTVDVEHVDRGDGKSNYTFGKLLRLAFDIIISFSEKPLRLSLRIGLFISIISFCIGLVYFTLYLLGHIKVPGYTSLVLLLSFHLGLTISFIGIVGLYVGKISLQVKNRPYFLIDKMIN